MTPEIVDGDYVKKGESLRLIEHINELLQSISTMIKTERGSFYPDKNFGSHIFGTGTAGADDVLSLARQAVDGISGVYIKSAEINGGNYTFKVIINNEERQVLIKK